jgi:hypothetical protein
LAENQWPHDGRKLTTQAVELARAHFTEREDQLALKRLPRGLEIAMAQKWTRLGDEQDTWLIPSQSRGGVVYQVNGRCTCPDFESGVRWCKHRLARALAKRATRSRPCRLRVCRRCATPAG